MSNGYIPYDHRDKTTNVRNRLKKFKTKIEGDAVKVGKSIAKSAKNLAGKVRIPKMDTPETLTQPSAKKKTVRSPARAIPTGATQEGRTTAIPPSPAPGIPIGQYSEAPNAVQTRLASGLISESPTAPLTRPQTVSETRGLQDRTVRGGKLGPTSVEAPSFVKSVEGMMNPLYDPETLRPGMRRTETGHFTDAPPPHLNITPFDTAEERAAKQKGLEGWFGGVADFHSEQGIGRQTGLRERALAHVKGKYGLEEKRVGTAGRIREQEIASGGVVEASKQPGVRGGRRFSTVDEYEAGEKIGEGIYDTYTGKRAEGGVGAAEMPDYVAQFRAGKFKSIDEMGRAIRDSDISTEEYKRLIESLTSSQQTVVNEIVTGRAQ